MQCEVFILKKMFLIFGIGVLLSGNCSAWEFDQSTDNVTNGFSKILRVNSILNPSETLMIRVANDGRVDKLSVYIATNKTILIESDYHALNVKFDDEKFFRDSIIESSNHIAIMFNSERSILKKMIKHKRMRASFTESDGEFHEFDFDISGLKDEISKNGMFINDIDFSTERD